MNIVLLSESQIKDIYKTRLVKDFPRDEVRPLSRILGSLSKGEYVAFGLNKNEEILGYAFCVKLGERYLLDYFAIRDDVRDSGYGSEFLRLIKETLDDAECFICEVESPEDTNDMLDKEVREKRYDFYIRNGFTDTKAVFRTFGVCFNILELPLKKTHVRDEAAEFYCEFYGKMLPKLMYKVNVKRIDSL